MLHAWRFADLHVQSPALLKERTSHFWDSWPIPDLNYLHVSIHCMHVNLHACNFICYRRAILHACKFHIHSKLHAWWFDSFIPLALILSCLHFIIQYFPFYMWVRQYVIMDRPAHVALHWCIINLQLWHDSTPCSDTTYFLKIIGICIDKVYISVHILSKRDLNRDFKKIYHY